MLTNEVVNKEQSLNLVERFNILIEIVHDILEDIQEKMINLDKRLEKLEQMEK